MAEEKKSTETYVDFKINDIVSEIMDENRDPSVRARFSIVGDQIVFRREAEDDSIEMNEWDKEFCRKIFCKDPMASELLNCIVLKNVNANQIVIKRINGDIGSTFTQLLDKGLNPDYVLDADSSFAVILTDADYGMDVLVWELNN